jgi:nucleoside phosphorylase
MQTSAGKLQDNCLEGILEHSWNPGTFTCIVPGISRSRRYPPVSAMSSANEVPSVREQPSKWSKEKIEADMYTVAWFCVTEDEWKAASDILDWWYEAPKRLNGDTYYTYGSIKGHHGTHYVVMIRPEKPGKAAMMAASAREPLISNFPRLQHAFVVGISGGLCTVDSGKGLHKGDVVVAHAVNGNPAVIQYDLRDAKGLSDFLLRDVSDKTARHLQSCFNTWYGEYNKRNERILDSLAKSCESSRIPDFDDDSLFRPEDEHRGTVGDCAECRKRYRTKYRPRKKEVGTASLLKVHRGLVLTGDTLIRSAEAKAELMGRHPHALCVDMESAVLMEGWHPLIIRGISDYADSHYNWNWVKYASAVAAAVAKGVIEMLYTRDQQMFPRHRGSVDRPPAGEHRQLRLCYCHMDLRRYSDTIKAGTSDANATCVSLQQNRDDERAEADEPIHGQSGTHMSSLQGIHQVSDLLRTPLSDDRVPPPPAALAEAMIPATSRSFQEALPQHRPVGEPRTQPDPDTHRDSSAPPEDSTTITVPDSQRAVSKPPSVELLRLSQIEKWLPHAVDLIDSGVNVKAKDKDGNTPLHHSVKHGDTALTQKLLDVEPSLASEENLEGETPLHLCAQFPTRESLAHARLLLSGLERRRSYCVPNIKDALGRTALDYAMEDRPTMPRKEMVQLLLDGGAIWPSSGSRHAVYTDIAMRNRFTGNQTSTPKMQSKVNTEMYSKPEIQPSSFPARSEVDIAKDSGHVSDTNLGSSSGDAQTVTLLPAEESRSRSRGLSLHKVSLELSRGLYGNKNSTVRLLIDSKLGRYFLDHFDSRGSLANLVCVNAESGLHEASTLGDYIARTWPTTGKLILGILEEWIEFACGQNLDYPFERMLVFC